MTNFRTDTVGTVGGIMLAVFGCIGLIGVALAVLVIMDLVFAVIR